CSNWVDMQSYSKTLPVSQHDLPFISGAIRVKGNFIPAINRWIIRECGAYRLRNGIFRIVVDLTKLDQNARIYRSFSARDVAHRNESAPPLPFARSPLHNVTACFSIEPDAVHFIEGDGTAI